MRAGGGKLDPGAGSKGAAGEGRGSPRTGRRPAPPHCIPGTSWAEHSSAAENPPGPSAGRSAAVRARRGSFPGALAASRRLPQSWRRGRPAARGPAASWRSAPEHRAVQMEHNRRSSAERSRAERRRAEGGRGSRARGRGPRMRGRPEAQAREGRRDVGGANGMPRPDSAGP